MADELSFPLEIDLDTKGKRPFRSVEELAEFVNSQYKNWHWLAGSRLEPVAKAAFDKAQLLDQAKNVLDNACQDAQAGQLKADKISDLKGKVTRAFKEAPFFLPDSAEGQFILRIKEEFNDLTSAGAFLQLDGRKPLEDAIKTGAVIAAAFRYSGRMETDRSAFDAMLNDCRTKADDQRDEMRKTITSQAAEIAAFRGQMEESAKAAKVSWDEMKKDFEKIAAIKEPASYWQTRQWSHFRAAVALAITIIAVGYLGGDKLIEWSTSLKPSDATPADTSLWNLITKSFPIFVAGIGLFWLLRILVRIFLSSVHLSSDASERVVLAKTFLALEAGERKLGDETLKLVLTQLFRHAATGVVKDDAAPQMVLAKMLTRE